MGVAIIGGLLTSTVLTLGIVPVVYSLLDEAREKVMRRRLARRGEGAPAAAPEAPSA
jgi:HAE1 family hydrophobic/amphiphilic exporter-1